VRRSRWASTSRLGSSRARDSRGAGNPTVAQRRNRSACGVDEGNVTEPIPAYEDRYLALVDIMGWSETVKKSVTDEQTRSRVHDAARAISRLPEFANGVNGVKFPDEDNFPAPDIRVSYFSDTVVISLPPTDTAPLYLTMMLRQLCEVLLNSEHYIRGAVVRGFVSHSDGVLYGPALVEAHVLECKTAVYPRILITPEAAKAFTDVDDMKTDTDGLTYLHLLYSYDPSPQYMAWLRDRLAFVRRNEESDVGDLHRLAKHRWFKSYLSSALREAEEKANRPSFAERIRKAVLHAEDQLAASYESASPPPGEAED
jgi:hypothetical protein